MDATPEGDLPLFRWPSLGLLLSSLAVGIAYLLRGYQLELWALLLLGVVFTTIQLFSIVVTKSLSQSDAELVDSVADQTRYDLSPLRRLVDRFA